MNCTHIKRTFFISKPMFWWHTSAPICQIKYVKIQYNYQVLHAICLCQHAYGLSMSTYIILWKRLFGMSSRFLITNFTVFLRSTIFLINYSQTALFEIWKYQLFFSASPKGGWIQMKDSNFWVGITYNTHVRSQFILYTCTRAM